MVRSYEKFGIPGVIGVIDGTHIAIVPPKSDDPVYPEHVYVNRKGNHSINTQLVISSILLNIIDGFLCKQIVYIMLNIDLRFKPQNFECLCKISRKYT